MNEMGMVKKARYWLLGKLLSEGEKHLIATSIDTRSEAIRRDFHSMGFQQVTNELGDIPEFEGFRRIFRSDCYR